MFQSGHRFLVGRGRRWGTTWRGHGRESRPCLELLVRFVLVFIRFLDEPGMSTSEYAKTPSYDDKTLFQGWRVGWVVGVLC